MPEQNGNYNQNMNGNGRTERNGNNGQEDDMTYLPESPDTPTFGPPQENVPASPYPDNSMQLPTPSLPSMPPSTGIPVYPSRPSVPGNGQRPPVTVYPIPIIPRPPQNNRQGYCTIRFIHAVVGHEAVNVAIGNKTVVHNLQYGEVSSYYIETDGFKTINVANNRMRRMIIASETFLFNDGDVYTIAFVNSMNGLAMYLISDMPCRNQRQYYSCVRAANLSYNAPALDVTVQSDMVRFEDLRFKTVSSYKQIMQGKQEFYVSETMSGAAVFNTTEQVNAREMYTLYIIGDAYTYPGLTPLFTEDYSGLLD